MSLLAGVVVSWTLRLREISQRFDLDLMVVDGVRTFETGLAGHSWDKDGVAFRAKGSLDARVAVI